MEPPKRENKLVAIETPLSSSGTEIAVTNKMENRLESEVAPAIETFKELTIADHIATKGSEVLKSDTEEFTENETQGATEPEIAPKVEKSEPQSDQMDPATHIIKDKIEDAAKTKAASIAEAESQDEVKFNANLTVEADVKDENEFKGASVIEVGVKDTTEPKATSTIEAAVENGDKLEVGSATESGTGEDIKFEIAPATEADAKDDIKLNVTFTAEPDVEDAATEVGVEDAAESEATSIVGTDVKNEAELKEVSTTEVNTEEHKVAQVSSELSEDTIDAGTDTVRVTLKLEPDGNGSGTIATVLEVKPLSSQEGEPEGPAPGLNPYFEAEIRGQRYDTETAIKTLVEDMDRCGREGDLDVRCISCDEVGHGLTCGKCKHTTYCSPECQREDWPIHKKFCNDFAGAASDGERPNPKHCRILFFPTFREKPQLLWAIPQEIGSKIWLDFEHPDLDQYQERSGIKDLKGAVDLTVINFMNTLGSRRVNRMLVSVTYGLVSSPQVAIRPKLLNQSLNALNTPGHLRPYFGPMAFYTDARRPNEMTSPRIRNITARDISNIVRVLELCDCTGVAEPARYPGKVISGLRINDPKDDLQIAMGVKNIYVPTHVPLQPVYSQDYVIAMAFYLGLRWYIRPGNFVGLTSGFTTWNDGNLRYLAYVCNVREEVTGSESARIAKYDAAFNYGPFAGSVIILHGSGNPVDMHHVFAFNAYLDEVYVKKEFATEENFKKYWAEYKDRVRGPVSSVPSPYKWEKERFRDKLGVFDPSIVTTTISSQIRDVWLAIADNINRGFN